MAIYLQGQSALEHYRRAGAALDFQPDVDISELPDASSSLAASQDARVYRADVREPSAEYPLHVLVRKREQRSRSKAVIPRVWSSRIPSGAFSCVSEGLFVSSPEFLFLQMARDLELPQLVALGMELCGTYRQDVPMPRLGEDGYDYVTDYHAQALTTPTQLRSFVKQMKGAPGARDAHMALRYVLPGSASPMETAVCLLLCLPRRLGGYALPLPTLNPAIKFNKGGQRYTFRMSARPDLYWKDAKLDVEYHGDDFHTDENRAADSMRRKALESMGIEVIELTKDEVRNEGVFHAVVMRIAKSLRKPIRYDAPDRFEVRRTHLRAMLFPSNADTKPLYLPIEGHEYSDEYQDWMPADQFDDLAWEQADWDIDPVPDSEGGRIFGARHA